MNKKIKIAFLFLLTLFVYSCNITKQVPKDRYLLKNNRLLIYSSDVSYDAIDEIIRQHPNRKFLGVRWGVRIYNSIDSIKIAEKRIRKNNEIKHKNSIKIARQNRINDKRIQKALKRGDSLYTKKISPLLDTIEPSLFFKEWLKYRVGESPVLFDSLLHSKSVEQINVYLKKKGFYQANVQSKIIQKRKKKVVAAYYITPNQQYLIDSVYVSSSNPTLIDLYNQYKLEQGSQLLGEPFDIEKLEAYQIEVSKFFRDNAIYGFSSSYVTFEVDTNRNDKKATIGVLLNDLKEVENDVVLEKSFSKTYVKDIFFHIEDTLMMKGDYKKALDELGLDLKSKYLPTIDTLYFNQILKRNSTDINPNRAVYFLYNGEMFVDPIILEAQTMLEKNRELNENLIEETFLKLNTLSLFHTVKVDVKPTSDPNYYSIHYYLYPSKKESFTFQPRVSTSNGFIGVSAGINYTNKNLFRGAEKLTLSINGGFQSQPLIFEDVNASKDLVNVTNRFYQFEISPSAKLELPGLWLIKNSKSNKSRNGKTIIGSAFGYQKRDVFAKQIFQMNYSWQYTVNKSQKIQMGLPAISQIKFVDINKSSEFQQQLNLLNDPFLTNTYSNQFIWQDWSFKFEYKSDLKEYRKQKTSYYFRSNLDLAGNFLKMFQKYQVKDTSGQYLGANRLFGLVYSQFGRLDNELIISKPFTKTRSFNFRALAGAGIPYGNSTTSMPYDYSFYAGGANDVRGWRARSLGPGGYKYYLDTSRTIVQVGDIRIVGSAEYRFQFSDFLKGALFLDAGNIWTLRDDANRVGSNFSKDWYKQIGVAGGIGFRMDFEYFLIRFDLGFKLHNPALPNGERWFFQSRDKFNQEIIDFVTQAESNGGTVTMSKLITSPFTPQISFGIGYPF